MNSVPTTPKSQIINMNSISTTPESALQLSFIDLFGIFPEDLGRSPLPASPFTTPSYHLPRPATPSAGPFHLDIGPITPKIGPPKTRPGIPDSFATSPTLPATISSSSTSNNPPASNQADQSTPLPDLLRYNSRLKLLLCIEHGYHLTRADAFSHLRNQHKGYRISRRSPRTELLNTIARLDLVESDQDFCAPKEVVARVPELGTPFWGIQCAFDHHCFFRAKSMLNIRKHLKADHDWFRARGPAQDTRYPICSYPMQFLWAKNKVLLNGYIRVAASTDMPANDVHRFDQIDTSRRRGPKWPKSGAAHVSSDSYEPDLPSNKSGSPSRRPEEIWSSPARPVHDSKDKREVNPDQWNPWLQRTGWLDMFGQRNLYRIHRMAGLPETFLGPFDLVKDLKKTAQYPKKPTLQSSSRTEDVVRIVHRGFESFMIAVLETVTNSSYNVRQQVNSHSTNLRYSRALKRLRLNTSEKRYINIWKQLLALIMRMSQVSGSDQLNYWGVQLDADTHACAEQLYNIAEQLKEKRSPYISRTMDVNNQIDIDVLEQRLEHTLRALCIALIMPRRRLVDQHRYPLVYFAGVLGLTHTETYVPVQDYTSRLAALIWIIRALFLHITLPEDNQTRYARQQEHDDPHADSDDADLAYPDEDADIDEDADVGSSKQVKRDLLDSEMGLSEAESDPDEEGYEPFSTTSTINTPSSDLASNETALRARDEFTRKRLKYLNMDSEYPFGELVHVFRFGRKLGAVQQGRSKVYWSADWETIQLKKNGNTFTMTQFRTFARGVLQSAITALDDLLFSMPDQIDLNSIQDAMNNSAQGYSFIDQYDPELLRQRFLDHIATLHDSNIQGPFKYYARGPWRPERINEYLQQITAALEVTLVAIHIWCGSPARGSELTLLRYRNSKTDKRTMYWVLDTFLLDLTYNKSVSVTADQGSIGRIIPERLSRALARFLLYVRPSLSYLCDKAQLPFLSSDYLFRTYRVNTGQNTPDHWHSKTLSSLLVYHSARYGLNFGIASYRQSALAINQNQLTSVAERFRKDPDLHRSRLLTTQAGHCKFTESHSYNQNGHFPHHMQPAHIMTIEQASREWHAWLDPTDAVTGLNKPNSEPNSPSLKSTYRDSISPASPVFHAPQSNRNPMLTPRKKATMQCKASDPVCADSTSPASSVFYTPQSNSSILASDTYPIERTQGSAGLLSPSPCPTKIQSDMKRSLEHKRKMEEVISQRSESLKRLCK